MKAFITASALALVSTFVNAQVDLSNQQSTTEHIYTGARYFQLIKAGGNKKHLQAIKDHLASIGYDVSKFNPKDVEEVQLFHHPKQDKITLADGSTARVRYQVSYTRILGKTLMHGFITTGDGTEYLIKNVEEMEDVWLPFQSLANSLPGVAIEEQIKKVKVTVN